MEWARILAYITGTVDQELLLRNEYLTTENRILRAQIKGRLLLSDAEKKTLADIGYRLGRKALEDVANTAKPDTILGWYRRLVARKFDGSKSRRYPGRPRIDAELEDLVVRIAQENVGWGYDRIVGALANLGYTLSDETVGNILRRNGIPPAPARKHTTTWKAFIRAHMGVLAGTDFFTVERHIREHELDAARTLAYRTEHALERVDAFFAWCDAQCQRIELTPSNPLAKALQYAREREGPLRVYLTDPSVAIDTNHLERALRPIPMGRKAWLFCWTEVGAQYVGIIQSLVSTCRLHGINPYTYLVDVLQRIALHPDSEVEQLTPRRWKSLFADKPLRSDVELAT